MLFHLSSNNEGQHVCQKMVRRGLNTERLQRIVIFEVTKTGDIQGKFPIAHNAEKSGQFFDTGI